YGSLSLTGKGHRTDQVIIDTLGKPCEVSFELDWKESFPNGFYLDGYDSEDNLVYHFTVFSLGGGSIQIKEMPVDYNKEVYTEKSFSEIKDYCEKNELNLWQYVLAYEPDIEEHLKQCLRAMIKCVEQGLVSEGMLPGPLKVSRSASSLLAEAIASQEVSEKRDLCLMAYAYSANEENASNKTVVTAPTLGACGVMASLMYYLYKDRHMPEAKLIKALAVGGIFGNLIKQNASISGAVGGCQAEVGTACSMAAAALAYCEGLGMHEIEYAAEIAMEHNLGLTCDPVEGYVIIPCIERNAMGILRSFDAVLLSKRMSSIKKNKISFDMVVETMNYTGKKLPVELKETSLGGLALEYEVKIHEKN
ncbi:MAG: L-serine ammonia-lyase, iron-sulfur-dependent, subunit alpha, partial [Erysipelotrichaceae bacterium]|nr:L-serine ammonia-lyase, iron-sulfur-dependent, subunit alpha [Erysipelotrichaceae bacterium]